MTAFKCVPVPLGQFMGSLVYPAGGNCRATFSPSNQVVFRKVASFSVGASNSNYFHKQLFSFINFRMNCLNTRISRIINAC